jgi:hypothetical protein
MEQWKSNVSESFGLVRPDGIMLASPEAPETASGLLWPGAGPSAAGLPWRRDPLRAPRAGWGGQRASDKLIARVSEAYQLTNLLEQAINCDDPDQAARIIRDALGIESDDVVNYCFPTTWPTDRERRARYIGEWLKTEARYLAS